MQASEQLKLFEEMQMAKQADFAYNQYFAQFFEQKNANLIEAFRLAPIGNDQVLKNIHCMFKALDALKVDLLTTIETGKLAEIALNAEGTLQ